MYPARLISRCLHISMPVLGRSSWRYVTHHGAHALGIGLAQLHAVLRTSHLARSDHFHGAGDLLSALNTRDLGANFLASSHTVRYQV